MSPLENFIGALGKQKIHQIKRWQILKIAFGSNTFGIESNTLGCPFELQASDLFSKLQNLVEGFFPLIFFLPNWKLYFRDFIIPVDTENLTVTVCEIRN